MTVPGTAPAAPNAAVQELRRLGLTANKVGIALAANSSTVQRWFRGAKQPNDAARAKVASMWPTVLPSMWSEAARASRAVRMLGAPRTSSEPATTAELLEEGRLTAAETRAARDLELRRHTVAVTCALEAITLEDKVRGHVGYVAVRTSVLGLVAPDPDLHASLDQALPGLEPGGALDVLRESRRALEALRDALRAEAAACVAERNVTGANKLDAQATRAEVGAAKARLSGVKIAELLKSDVWAETVIEVCAVLRGDADAIEDVLDELRAEVEARNPFAVALSSALRNVRHIVWPCTNYQKDPHGFFRDVLGLELYDKQLEVLDSVRDGQWVAVRSGHKVGKSCLLAGLALWAYCCFPRARVFIVAPTDHQLQSIAWREIRMRILESGVCIACREGNEGVPADEQVQAPCPHSAKIDGVLRETARAGLHSHDLRHITGLSVRQPEAAAGLSGENLFFFGDEASGIPQPILTTLKGNLAGGGWLILFSNPTQPEGEFFDAFHPRKVPGEEEAKGLYVTHTISSWDTPNARDGLRKGDPGYIPGLATRDWCEARAKEWGKDSEDYHVRVLGLHFFGSTSRLLPVQLLIEAEERFAAGAPDDEQGPLIIGVDPCGAQGSGDDAGFAPRRGNRILEVWGKTGPLTADEHLSEVLAAHTRWARNPRERMVCVIGAEGVGVAIVARFRLWAAENPSRMTVIALHTQAKSSYEPNVYDRLRDGLAGHFAAWLKQGGAIPPDLKLNGELRTLALKLKLTNKGERLKLKPKDEIKKEIHRSPDLYEAVAAAVWGERTSSEWADEQSEALEVPDETGSTGPGGVDPYAGGADPYA